MTTATHRMTVHSVGALHAGGETLTNYVMLTGGKDQVADIGKAFGEEIEITRAPGAPACRGDLNVIHGAVRVMRHNLRSDIEIGCLAQNGEAEVSATTPPAPHSLGDGMQYHVADEIGVLRAAMTLLKAAGCAQNADGQPDWLDRVIDGSLDIFPRGGAGR